MYYHKYQKYKSKYLNLKKELDGGGKECKINQSLCGDTYKFFDYRNYRCCNDISCEGCNKLPYIELPNTSYICETTPEITPIMKNRTIKIEGYIDIKGFKDNRIRVPKSIKLESNQSETETIIFAGPTILGKGGFSNIIQYKQGELKIAVKIGEISKDKQMIQFLPSSTCGKLVIPSFISHDQKHIVMEVATGSLQDLINENINSFTEGNTYINIIFILDILQQVTFMLKCLSDKNYIYTDIKPDNILYKCVDSRIPKIQLFLGDLGSAGKPVETPNIYDKPIYTYPPFDKKTESLQTKPEESDIVWGIGILLLFLYGYDKKPGNIEDIKTKLREIDKNKISEIDVIFSGIQIRDTLKDNMKRKINRILNEVKKDTYKKELFDILSQALRIDTKKTFFGKNRINLNDLYNLILSKYKIIYNKMMENPNRIGHTGITINLKTKIEMLTS